MYLCFAKPYVYWQHKCNFYSWNQLSLLEEDSNDTKNVLSDLIRKLNMIDGNLTAQLDNLQNQLVIQQSIITNNTQEIFDNHESFNDVVTSLNLTLQAQLFNISKQEGPRVSCIIL